MTKKYILYIEDDSFQRKLYSGVIQRIIDSLNLEYTVISVDNSEDVLNFLKGKGDTLKISKQEIGIILCDLLLPEFSGLQFLKEVKNLKNQIPVVILTVDDDEKIKEKAIELGAFEYIIKGKDQKELDKLIKVILKKME